MREQGTHLPNEGPCPCCGRLVFERGPGTDEICPVCFWQDDLLCLLEPFEALGPNKVSLAQAQRNFSLLGVCDPRYGDLKGRLLDSTNFAADEEWRPIDLAKDRFSKDHYPEDKAQTYYWRPDYWLSSERE